MRAGLRSYYFRIFTADDGVVPTSAQLGIGRVRTGKCRISRTPALRGCPQKKATCLAVLERTPRKPNSAKRKIAKVRFPKFRSGFVFIPGIGHTLGPYSRVLARGGRTQDLPGLKYKVIRGKFDALPPVGRFSSRSKYGIGRGDRWFVGRHYFTFRTLGGGSQVGSTFRRLESCVCVGRFVDTALHNYIISRGSLKFWLLEFQVAVFGGTFRSLRTSAVFVKLGGTVGYSSYFPTYNVTRRSLKGMSDKYFPGLRHSSW